MAKQWGEELAIELVRGLAHHRVLGIPLTKLEPDLDPFCHHTNMPIAIVYQHVIDKLAWPHIIGLVEGPFVLVDQPIPNTRLKHHITGDADVAAALRDLDAAATGWSAGGHERLGTMDATLAAMVYLRRAGQVCWMHLGDWNCKTACGISARRGGYRWPAGVRLVITDDGIEVTCGASKRIVHTLADLADFPTRELPEFVAQIARCEAYAASTERARVVATAAFGKIQDRLTDHEWTLSAALDTANFRLDDQPMVIVSGTGKTSTDVWFEGVTDGVTVRCNGGYQETFASAAALETKIDDVIAAVKKSLTIVTSANLIVGSRYRVKQAFSNANVGDVLTFECIEDQRFSDAWKWKGPKGTVYLGDKEAELEKLSEYLDPV